MRKDEFTREMSVREAFDLIMVALMVASDHSVNKFTEEDMSMFANQALLDCYGIMMETPHVAAL